MTTEAKSTEAVLRALTRACIQAGSQQAFAAELGISTGNLSEMLNGHRKVTRAVAAAVGFERVTIYRRTASQN